MEVYEVLIAGVPHTVQLDDDEAKRLGLKPVKVEAAARKPANKSRGAKNKG